MSLSKKNKEDLVEAIWKFLSSPRFAITMMVLITIASIIGTLIPQGRTEVEYLQRLGKQTYNILKFLGFTNLYYSWWFLGLLFLVCINLILSNLNRIEKVINRYYNPQIALDSEYYEKSPAGVKLTTELPLETVIEKIRISLKKLHYKVKEENREGKYYFYADKTRISNWGSFIAHLGILFLFAGAIYGHFPGIGFSKQTKIVEGEKYTVTEGAFSIELLDFSSRWNEKRLPLDYRSKVSIKEEEKEILKKTILVNKPLQYKGIKIYQTSFGPAGIKLNINKPDGEIENHSIFLPENTLQPVYLPLKVSKDKIWLLAFLNFQPDFIITDNGPASKSPFPANPAILVMLNEDFPSFREKSGHSHGHGHGEWKLLGWLSSNNKLTYNGYTFDLKDVIQYSEFTIKRDPGIPLIWLGFLAISMGAFIAYYLNHKVLRIQASEINGKVNINLIKARRDRNQCYKQECHSIKEILLERKEHQ